MTRTVRTPGRAVGDAPRGPGDAPGTPERILAALLESRAGHAQNLERSWMFASALQPLLRAQGLPNLEALVVALASHPDQALMNNVVDALINHETYFFRDARIFGDMNDGMLAALREQAAHRKSLRIWSVGCSTGQEPYSLAILMAERPDLWAGWDVKICATDISPSVIQTAKAARYSHFDVQRGLPARSMIDWFEPDGQDWLLRSVIRDKVQFLTHNLLADALPPGPFDLIMCRNLLYYLTPQKRALAVSRLAAGLAPGGLLMLGAFESMLDDNGQFVQSADARGCYTMPSRDPAPMARLSVSR